MRLRLAQYSRQIKSVVNIYKIGDGVCFLFENPLTAGARRNVLKISFLTLGCKVNLYETEKMKKMFENAGHAIVPFDEEADVYIINTCTVTNIADRKSRKMLHRARRLNPRAIVVAAGCYADSAKGRGEEDESIDLFILNKDKKKVVEIVCEEFERRNCVINDKDIISGVDGGESTAGQERTRAFIKIQDGCNQYCTYCIIPYVRGRLKSRSIEEILPEIEALAGDGHKEIVITGIHVSSYGVDDKDAGGFIKLGGRPLVMLLERINQVEGIERIRLSSLEPRIISEDFVKSLSNITKLCPHFHLSLQSGCDTVLKRMNRHYSVEEYLDKLQILRKYFVNPAVTTDIIVGFPGETQEEFNETCEFVLRAGFSKIHVFKYSRRKGTIADGMDNQIEESVKSERSDKLIKIQKELEKKYKKAALKGIEEVLIEEVTMIEEKKYFIGYNERYIRIAVCAEGFSETQKICNMIASVHVTGNLTDEIVLGEFVHYSEIV